MACPFVAAAFMHERRKLTLKRAPPLTTGNGPGSRSNSPAPGAYEVDHGQTVSARTKRTFNTTASGGKGSFGAFSKRDGLAKRDAGADVMYTVDTPGVNTGKAETIGSRSARSFNRDVNSGKGSFNSTSARSKSPAARSARGGPGENDCSHMFSCGSSGSVHVTSSFMSAQPLGGHIRKSDTPGVGEYEPNMVASKSFGSAGSAMFAGSLKRGSAANRSATGEHIGPGSYELDKDSLQTKLEGLINPRLPGFGSSSKRTGPGDE